MKVCLIIYFETYRNLFIKLTYPTNNIYQQVNVPFNWMNSKIDINYV